MLRHTCEFPLSKATAATDTIEYTYVMRGLRIEAGGGIAKKTDIFRVLRDDRTVRYGTSVAAYRRVWSRMGGWGERKSYARSGGTR